MNKLSYYRSTYEEASGKVSDLTRQMSLAGIAIIWIFRQPDVHSNIICKELIPPLLFFVFSLTFDLLQYIYKTIAWAIFFRTKEKRIKRKDPDPPMTASPVMNYPTWVLFALKVIFLIIGYIFIFIYLFGKLFPFN